MFKRFLLALATALLLPLAAVANPIDYIYTGTASGSFAGQGFRDASFVITGHADTANVGGWCCSNAQNTHSSADVSLSGFGTFSFSGATHTWIAENCCMGFGANLSANYLTLFSTPGLLNVGYTLGTAIGPIAAGSASTQGQFVNIGTSGGALTFSNVNNVTFEARMVPEPSTYALMALGLAGVAFISRRRYSAKA